ncbi:class I SAM-dependent methyltransferase [Luteibacter aegosomatis]|uniref:class I SAM-dependent methyltransferase n=1 Tax=Luteibacter aegosomatis TaxID=2911537 RepID=UPI001FF7971A|nr:methyltransferase domain-containing protein [Luteibacter aegosomatis]UPG87432.1 class I SAM-dependent methyltransferase [Luteibacter aegosomatis]
MNNNLACALDRLADGENAIPPLEMAAREGSVMAAAILDHLAGDDERRAYDTPHAFEIFIRAGGNPPLYESVSTALARLYERFAPRRLLDIGAGDGMALLPALNATSRRPHTVDVVEPSAELLARLRPQLSAGTARQQTFQAFASRLASGQPWDMAQATFSLQSIPSVERLEALKRLRSHVTRLVVVEFDVPVFDDARDRHASLARRYEQAAREYREQAPLVAGGFLAPMLLGQLQATTPSNFEQPIAAWQDEITRAGYRIASATHLHDYSWAPAWLIVAEA